MLDRMSDASPDSVPLSDANASLTLRRTDHDAFQLTLFRAGMGNLQDRARERQDRKYRQRAVLSKWRSVSNAAARLEDEMARLEYKASPKEWEQRWARIVGAVVEQEVRREAQREARRWEKKVEAEKEVLERGNGASRRGLALPTIRTSLDVRAWAARELAAASQSASQSVSQSASKSASQDRKKPPSTTSQSSNFWQKS